MPAQADLIIPVNRGIFRLHVIGDRNQRFAAFIFQAFVLHIADESVLGDDLAPGLHLLQHRNLVARRCLGKNITLDSALITDRRVPFDIRDAVLIPYCRHHHAVRLRIQSIGKIGILLHIIQSHIHHAIFQVSRHITVLSRLSCLRIDDLIRRGI